MLRSQVFQSGSSSSRDEGTLTVAIPLVDDGDLDGDLAVVGGHGSVPLAGCAALGQVDQVERRRQACVTAAQDQDLEGLCLGLGLGRSFKLGSHSVGGM